MEKVIVTLRTGAADDQWAERIRGPVAEQLLDLAIARLQQFLADSRGNKAAADLWPRVPLDAALDRLGLDATPLLVQRRIQRPAVDADADGHLAIARLGGDGTDVLGLADVARVEPQTVDTGFHRSQRHLVLVVDVGDDRDR